MTMVAKETPTKWYEVGIQLKIKIETLEAFKELSKDHNQLYSKVFYQWVKDEKVPYTWNTIISVLKKIGEIKTATTIKEWLDNCSKDTN